MKQPQKKIDIRSLTLIFFSLYSLLEMDVSFFSFFLSFLFSFHRIDTQTDKRERQNNEHASRKTNWRLFHFEKKKNIFLTDFLTNETNPQPLDLSVWGSRTTRQSLYSLTNKTKNIFECIKRTFESASLLNYKQPNSKS